MIGVINLFNTYDFTAFTETILKYQFQINTV
jgi:hypothetical protein